MEKTREFCWRKSVNANIITLRILGLWPRGDETYKLDMYAIYTTFCVSVLLCTHTFVQTFNIYFILNDLESFTQSIFVTLSCIGTVAKAYYLLQNMKILKELFVNMAAPIFQPKNDRQITLVHPSIKDWKFWYLWFRVSCVFTTIFWSSYPILDKWAKDYKLPFLAWYPYDFKQSPLYEITYVHQVVAIWYLVQVSLNIDCLIAALNMFIGAQCDLLCDSLKNLGRSNDLYKDLVESVVHHKEILRFAEKSNKFFNWIVLLQFFTSAISVGFSMFELTVVKPFTSQFYSFICYTTAITVEMFIYCWFGNEVEIKSGAIPNAVFECNWIGQPLGVQRSIIIFTIRAQRPIKMSALELFYLSVDTFKTILRTSWSYFTLLNQVNNK